MACIPESWIQDVTESIHLPALSPPVSKLIALSVETQMKCVIQLANKFQRRGKAPKLSVDDFNLALGCNGLEHVYGCPTSHQIKNALESGGTVIIEDDKLALEEYVKTPLPKCPLLSDLTLHWLAVEGVQPHIPENPSVLVQDISGHPLSLSKEMQFFFSRVTGVLLSTDSDALMAAYAALEKDAGLEALAPYLCRFIYSQVKENTRKLPLLFNLIRAVRALLGNSSIHLDGHLHQLMPALFTCVVGVRLSSSPEEDHWSLRQLAAVVISVVCTKFADTFVDVLPRACKTYLEALGDDRPLSTVYGGLVGLQSLGHNVIRTVLLPNLSSMTLRLKLNDNHVGDLSSSNNPSAVGVETVDNVLPLPVQSLKGKGKDKGKADKQHPPAPAPIPSNPSKTSRISTNNNSSSHASVVRSGDTGVKTAEGAGGRGRVRGRGYLNPHALLESDMARCRSMIQRILGEYTVKRMRSCVWEELEGDLLPRTSSAEQSKRRKMIRTSVTTTIADLQIAEKLVPYYVSSSKELNHVRMFI